MRGKWTTSKVVLSCYFTNSTVTVPGANGCTIRAAYEDVRFALPDESLPEIIHQANDELDDEIQELVSHVASKDVEILPSQNDSIPMCNPSVFENTAIFSSNDDFNVPKIGDNLEVYWSLDKQC